MKMPVLLRSVLSWIPLLVLQGAALPLTADLGSPAPPWSIGSPAAAGSGARFGLGLHYDFEHSEEWESSTTGVQVPLALSCFRPGSLCLFPTLTLEAASVDVTLNPRRSFSRSGSGDLFGAGLDVAFALCESCSGFVSGGYRFRTIPGIDLQGDGKDRPGEARLGRDVHVALARLGYVLPGSRFAPYVGVRGQWRDADIEVGSRRTKLESEVVEGLLGVDARLWGPLFGRLEIMAGGPDEDCNVQVNLAYVGPRGDRPRLAERAEPPAELPGKTEERAREIADALAPRLAEILAELIEARRRLPTETGAAGLPVYPRGAVAALLNDTERDLLAAFPGPDLAAMRDYVQDLFRQARFALRLQPGARAALQPSGPVRLAALHPSLLQPSPPNPAALDKGAADFWLDRIGKAIEKILAHARNDDLVVDLCVKSNPRNRAELRMHPVSYEPLVKKVRTTGRLVNVWRGLYSYTVSRRGFKKIQSTLDLVDESGPVIYCELVADSEPDSPFFCEPRSGSIERECPE